MPTLQELLDRERVRTGTSGPSIISELLDTLAARQQEATVPQIIPPSLPGGGYLPRPITPPSLPGGGYLPQAPGLIAPPGPLPGMPSLTLGPTPPAATGLLAEAWAAVQRAGARAGVPPERLEPAGRGVEIGLRTLAPAETLAGISQEVQQEFEARREEALRTPLAQQTLEQEMLIAATTPEEFAAFQEAPRLREALGVAAEKIDIPRRWLKEQVWEPIVGVPGLGDLLEKAGVPPKIAGPLGGLLGAPGAGAQAGFAAAFGMLSDEEQAEVASYVTDPALVVFFPGKSVQAVRAAVRVSPRLATRATQVSKTPAFRARVTTIREGLIGRAGEAGLARPTRPRPGVVTPAQMDRDLIRRVAENKPTRLAQEEIRHLERQRRAAEIQRVRDDPTLTPRQKDTRIRQIESGPYYEARFEPMNMTDTEIEHFMAKAQASPRIRQYGVLPITKALGRLQAGRPLRAFEEKLLSDLFGSRMGEALAKRATAGRKAFDISRADELEIARLRKRQLVEEGRRFTEEQRRVAREYWKEHRAAEKGEAALSRIAAAQARQEATQIRQLRRELDALPDREARAGQREIARENRQAVRLREQLDNRYPNEEQLLRKAEALAVEAPEFSEVVRYWTQGNRAMLDSIGPTQGFKHVLRASEMGFTGDVMDSWVATLATRRMYLETGLEYVGLEPQIARRIGRLMFEAEVKQRYGLSVPPVLQESIAALRQPSLYARGEVTGTLEGMARAAEAGKNLMFGTDLGIFGIQARKALQGGGIPALLGAINRGLTTMHHPLFGNLYLESTLSKQARNILDGLHYGRGPSAVTGRGETLFRYLGKPGQMIDTPLAAVNATLADFQFKTILGGVRDTLYEGNLMILKLLRQDITNPVVRRKAAQWANTLTGWADPAQVPWRRQLERSLFISPPMTRAQFHEIGQLARLLSPTASSADRILAATTLVSYAATWLAAGKLLDDYFGIGDYILDPTKPGAGTVTFDLPGAPKTSIPWMADVSLKRAILRSMRHLIEAEPGEAAEDWERAAVGRFALLAGTLVTLGTGRGYTPEGMFQTDLERKEAAMRLLPMPPMLQELLYQGWNPMRLALEFSGINQYERPAYLEIEDQQDTYARSQTHPVTGKPFADFEEMSEVLGTPYSELLAREAVPALVELEKVAATETEKLFGPGIAQILERKNTEQERIDQEHQQKGAWRRAKKENDIVFAAQIAMYLHGDTAAAKALREDAPEDPFAATAEWTPDEIREAFFEVIRRNTNPITGRPVDSEYMGEQLDRFTGVLTEDQRLALDRNLGTRSTPSVKEYDHDIGIIAAVGYFDVTRLSFEAAGLPSPAKLQEAITRTLAEEEATRNLTPGQRADLVDQIYDNITEAPRAAAAAVRKTLREGSPTLLDLLVEWDIYDTGAETTRPILWGQ